MKWAEHIKKCIRDLGIKQNVAAMKMGVSAQTVNSWLKGRSEPKSYLKNGYIQKLTGYKNQVDDLKEKQVIQLMLERLNEIKASWRSHMTDRDGIRLAVNILFKKNKHVILNWLEEEQESDKKKYMATGTDG